MFRQEYTKNIDIGFPLPPLQKHIDTDPHPQTQVADAKIFNPLRESSMLGKSKQTEKIMKRLRTQSCN